MAEQGEHNEKQQDSKTRVYPRRSHGVGRWNNPRVTLTVRVDEGVRKAFVPWAKAYFRSVCNAVESIAVVLMQGTKAPEVGGVHPNQKEIKIDIGRVLVQRHLKPRRRLEYDSRNVRFCSKPATDSVIYRGLSYLMCEDHAREYSRYEVTDAVVPLELEASS